MISKRFIALLIPMLSCFAWTGKSQETKLTELQEAVFVNHLAERTHTKNTQEAKMIPMLTIGNKWNTYKQCEVFDGTAKPPKKLGEDKTTYHYSIKREVELEGKKYFEILRDGELCFFMREDLTTGKVYRKYPEREEILIFDYALKEGDVFIWENAPLKEGFKKLRMKVISISDKEINGSKRRVYQLAFAPYFDQEENHHQEEDPFGKYTKGDPFQSHSTFFLDTGFWIEGIGGNQGLGAVQYYDLVGGHCTCEELLCFTNATGETFTLYPESGCEINYKVPLSVETPLLSKAKVVYSEGQLQISLEDAKPHTFSVYNMAGQLLAHQETFENSVVVRLPASVERGTVLIRIDNESTLYTF